MKNITAKNEIEVSVKGARIEDVFVLIEASKLSLDDAFMDYNPTTKEEKELKKAFVKAIESGLKDFYSPVIDPSFNEDGGICYAKGKKPAVGKSYNWWKQNAEKFCPQRNSRLGTKTEYYAFLGMLIKKLVVNGWKVSNAWDAICNSVESLFRITHYSHKSNSLFQYRNHLFLPTGSEEFSGYCDMGNTFKILAGDKEDDGFWTVGGFYLVDLFYGSLVYSTHFIDCDDDERDISVGWLILEK